MDTLPGASFSYVLDVFFGCVYIVFKSGVDLDAETFTGQGFLRELFPDCFKSELMETLNSAVTSFEISPLSGLL